MSSDPLTGLPWSFELAGEVGQWAQEHEVHAILTWLSGFEALIEVYGLRPAQTCLRHIVRRIAGRLDARDRLSRHSASSLLVFTIRVSEEIQALQAGIAGDVAAAGVDVRDMRLPRTQIRSTSVGPVADPGASIATLDALMISLEAAVTAVAAPSALPPGPLSRPPVPSGRVILENVNVEIAQGTTSVSCVLGRGGDHVSATSVGHDGEARRHALVADAAAQAVAKLLPAGHRLSVRSVRSMGEAPDEGVWVVLEYLTPADRAVLHGVAPVGADRYSSIARAVLSALNRFITRTN